MQPIEKKALSILFVCMGNICRSSTADGVMRHLVKEAGWQAEVMVDSAGTHDYHVGNPPDRRTQVHALRRGYDLSPLRARQVEISDLETFDYVLAMDRANMALLQRFRPPTKCADLQFFTQHCRYHNVREVPDPYSGGEQGFERVLDLIEDGCQGLLQEIEQRFRSMGLTPSKE